MRIILSILLLSVCYPAVINVPTDSTTIQAGINGAGEGDTVLVSAGTYYENIDFKENCRLLNSLFCVKFILLSHQILNF